MPGKLFYENQYASLLRLQGCVQEVAFELVRPGRDPVLAVYSIQDWILALVSPAAREGLHILGGGAGKLRVEGGRDAEVSAEASEGVGHRGGVRLGGALRSW